MAIVFGGVFGWIYLYTGNLLGPILAHFTINFFNIMSITQRYGEPRETD
jgi:membrane protease YdiL (CAAX protease family)